MLPSTMRLHDDYYNDGGLSNPLNLLVAGGGIEPPTQGFSVLCSTD